MTSGHLSPALVRCSSAVGCSARSLSLAWPQPSRWRGRRDPPRAPSPSPAPGASAAVTARPGPGPGQVTFSWKQDGSHTTAFIIETGLTSFKVGDPNLPDHGRAAKYFAVASGRRSVTLSAAQVASAGASAGSANHLYYRLKAMNKTRSGTTYRDWPYLQSVAVAPATPSRSGAALRVAASTCGPPTPPTTPGSGCNVRPSSPRPSSRATPAWSPSRS